MKESAIVAENIFHLGIMRHNFPDNALPKSYYCIFPHEARKLWETCPCQ